MHDISHYLRPSHLAQLRKILDDPEASANDRFVALDLLKNANIAAAGVLPMCQDTGTAIVMGKRGQNVLTDGGDEEALSRGVYDAYTQLNLRYSQMAPLTMWEEKNTGSNLPAQIELYATDGGAYKFLFMAKGGGSPTSRSSTRRPRRSSTRASMMQFLEEKIRSLGTAACPPYHLAIVVGGTSAEFALKTAKYASAHYLDELPAEGSPTGHGFRDQELEEKVFELTQKIGIGAQFGGKYFCHDVRVIRLPAPRRVLPGRHRRLLLRRPPGPREDHRRGRLPGAAGDRPGAVPPGDHRRAADRPADLVRSPSTSTARWTRSSPS